MERHCSRWVMLVTALALLAAGCGTKGAGGTGTVPTADTTTTVDPWAVPAVIDVAYLQRVMNRLDQSLGDALRELVAAKAVDPKVEQILQAVYGQPELARTEHDLAVVVHAELGKYRPVPGNPTTKVQRVFSASPNCAFVSAIRTIAPALVNPPPEADTHAYLALRHIDVSTSSRQINPTGLVLVLDAFARSGAMPRNPCQ